MIYSIFDKWSSLHMCFVLLCFLFWNDGDVFSEYARICCFLCVSCELFMCARQFE